MLKVFATIALLYALAGFNSQATASGRDKAILKTRSIKSPHGAGPAQTCVSFLRWYFTNIDKTTYFFINTGKSKSESASINFNEVTRYCSDLSTGGYLSNEFLNHVKICFDVVEDSIKENHLQSLNLPIYAAEPLFPKPGVERCVKENINNLRVVKAKWEDDVNYYFLRINCNNKTLIDFSLTDRTGKWQIMSCNVFAKTEMTDEKFKKLLPITSTFPNPFVDKPASHIVIDRNDRSPAGVCINFLKWYVKYGREINNKYDLIDEHGFDTAQVYTVNFEEVRQYLDRFKKSGFVSVKFLDSLRNVYSRAQQYINQYRVNDGPVPGLEKDIILQDLEESLRPNINHLQVLKSVYDTATHQWTVELKASAYLNYVLRLKKFSNGYLVDSHRAKYTQDY